MNLRPGWCAWADDKRDRSTQDPRICIRHVPRVCKSYIAGSSEAWQVQLLAWGVETTAIVSVGKESGFKRRAVACVLIIK